MTLDVSAGYAQWAAHGGQAIFGAGSGYGGDVLALSVGRVDEGRFELRRGGRAGDGR